MTHEQYIQAIHALACASAAPASRPKLEAVKLTYGAGEAGLRGVTYFNKWTPLGEKPEAHPFVEICAFGEQSHLQLAGTTLHELAHVLAGPGHGHDKVWREACATLGIPGCKVHCAYTPETFDAATLAAIQAIPTPTDGAPQASIDLAALLGLGAPLRPCTAGFGTRGGTSRGQGSGSRNLKVTCGECGYTARVARSWLDKGQPHCGQGHGPMTPALACCATHSGQIYINSQLAYCAYTHPPPWFSDQGGGGGQV